MQIFTSKYTIVLWSHLVTLKSPWLIILLCTCWFGVQFVGGFCLKKGKRKGNCIQVLGGGIGSFWGRRKNSSLHKTDQLKEVRSMSSMNCAAAWIDLYILEIVFLSLMYYFHKADPYLWMKQRENNSALKTFWFSTALMSARPLAKHLINIFGMIIFHFPIYIVMCPKSSIVRRCFITSCFYQYVGKEFGMTPWWYSDTLWTRCVVWRPCTLHCGSFIFIFTQYITNLDTTVKITE